MKDEKEMREPSRTIMSHLIGKLTLLAVIFAVLVPGPARADGWKAGTATQKITPQASMSLWRGFWGGSSVAMGLSLLRSDSG